MNTLPKSALDQLAQRQRVEADSHLDADLVTAFCEGAVAGAERNRVMEHLARCGDCREIVFLAAPESISQLQAPADSVAVRSAASWWRRFMPAVAAAAATVVVGSAVLLNVYSNQKSAAQRTAGAEVAVPAVQPPSDVLTAKTDQAQTVPTRKELPSNIVAESVDKTAAFKKETPAAIGGLVGPAQPESRPRGFEPNAETLQRSATAAGPHGAVEPKGSQSNYQTLTATQTRPTRVAPGAHGDLEAKGNAYFYENAVQPAQVSNNGGSALPLPLAPAQSTAAKPASRSDGANVSASAPVEYAKVMPGPEKAKVADKKAGATEWNAANTEKKQVVADASTQDSFSSDVPMGEQDARRTLFITKHFQWRINQDGALQRSSGKDDWKPALAKTQTRFRVVSVIGNEVWAGGSSGKLYHSLDGGEHWMRIEVKASGQALSDTITSIDFRDSRMGMITTDSGTTWETADGGAHWTRK